MRLDLWIFFQFAAIVHGHSPNHMFLLDEIHQIIDRDILDPSFLKL